MTEDEYIAVQQWQLVRILRDAKRDLIESPFIQADELRHFDAIVAAWFTRLLHHFQNANAVTDGGDGSAKGNEPDGSP